MSKYKENLTEKEIIDYELYLRDFKKIADDGLETLRISIKEGFYTIFADDAKEAGYEVLNVSNGYFNGYISVYLKKRTETTVDWQQVRIQASIAAMQGVLSNSVYVSSIEHVSKTSKDFIERVSKISTEQADALVKKLKRK